MNLLTNTSLQRNSSRNNRRTQSKERWTLNTIPTLTHDEQKAAEAAFRGLPVNPRWSAQAQQVYLGILGVTNGRDIVTSTVADAETEPAMVAA